MHLSDWLAAAASPTPAPATSPDSGQLSDWLTVGISALALLVSMVVAWRQWSGEGRAHFAAKWVGSQTIEIVNLGPGNAREISLNLTGVALFDAGGVEFLPPRHPVPVFAVVATGSQVGGLSISWREGWLRKRSVVLPMSQPPSQAPNSNSSPIEKAIRDAARQEAQGAISDLGRGTL